MFPCVGKVVVIFQLYTHTCVVRCPHVLREHNKVHHRLVPSFCSRLVCAKVNIVLARIKSVGAMRFTMQMRVIKSRALNTLVGGVWICANI